MDVSVAAALAAVFGLIIGSFVNVVAYRIPAGKSVVSPPSACPSCDHPIRNRDNIPVVSWLLLKGRCRDCRAAISIRYPIVEATTGALFAATVLVIGLEWSLPAYLWFTGVTMALVLTDFDVKRIPNRILYPATVVGTALLLGGAVADGDPGDFWRGLAGAGIYFALFLVIALIARGGFGFGDVKLAFFLGEYLAFQSWGVLGAGVALGITIGGLIALGLLVLRRADRKTHIPFGPAMVAGAYLALVVGESLADWYIGG